MEPSRKEQQRTKRTNKNIHPLIRPPLNSWPNSELSGRGRITPNSSKVYQNDNEFIRAICSKPAAKVLLSLVLGVSGASFAGLDLQAGLLHHQCYLGGLAAASAGYGHGYLAGARRCAALRRRRWWRWSAASTTR